MPRFKFEASEIVYYSQEIEADTEEEASDIFTDSIIQIETISKVKDLEIEGRGYQTDSIKFLNDKGIWEETE